MQHYSLGPLTLNVHSAHAAQQELLAACWAQLFRVIPVSTPETVADDETVMLTLSSSLPAVRYEEPPAAQFGATAIWATEQGFHIACGPSGITVHQAHATGYIAAEFWARPLVEQRDFWQRIFFLLSRSANCHLLHANALLPPDPAVSAGVLLVGDCGSGKTTLTMSLLAAGWRYVTDDSVLLQPTAAGVMTHAVRRGFAATQQTAAAWPWLQPALAAGVSLNPWKTLVELDPLYPARYVPSCRPGLILFPTIADATQSTLLPLKRLECFTTLIGQPRSGLLVEPATTGTLLALYQTLAEQCRGYQLAAGMDVFQEPARVSALLLQAVADGAP